MNIYKVYTLFYWFLSLNFILYSDWPSNQENGVLTERTNHHSNNGTVSSWRHKNPWMFVNIDTLEKSSLLLCRLFNQTVLFGDRHNNGSWWLSTAGGRNWNGGEQLSFDSLWLIPLFNPYMRFPIFVSCSIQGNDSIFTIRCQLVLHCKKIE